MDISRERKRIEMSEITGLNSAVSYLTENTLELFTPTAETECWSAALGRPSVCVFVRREGGVRGLQGCLS